MASTLADRYRRWFVYEQDAHTKVIASLQSVPAEGRLSAEYAKAVGLLGHIVAARRVWLYRLGIDTEPVRTLFPENADLADVAADWQAVAKKWSSYLARVEDGDLAREFEYQSLDAGRFRNRVEDILMQLFGHSWYHRGQIAMLVRKAGGEPAVTDLVYWCREAVADTPP